jgi:hypothetical protein
LAEQFEVLQTEKGALAPLAFNTALVSAIRQLSIDANSLLVYRSVQIAGYADHVNIMGRSMQRVVDIHGTDS